MGKYMQETQMETAQVLRLQAANGKLHILQFERKENFASVGTVNRKAEDASSLLFSLQLSPCIDMAYYESSKTQGN